MIHMLTSIGSASGSRREERDGRMSSLTSGTIVGAGSFRCRHCGYVLTLTASDPLADCPGCGGRDFVRASLFSAGRPGAGPPLGQRASALADTQTGRSPLWRSESAADHIAQLASAREQIQQPGEYISYDEGGEVRTIALTREWTRVGRSLAADVRFDDPTVSRRHALIVRQPDGVRVLDDRSLNGVFVNGARIEGKVLKDGDEIIVGRYRLSFLSVQPQTVTADDAPADDSKPLHAIH
jgi:pSer/pThr/pTyr-binding forkhead associated (FHA) protein/DNA-directed RNA polymerase subunit RPC12/RpoP